MKMVSHTLSASKSTGDLMNMLALDTCYFNGKVKGASKKFPSHAPWRAFSLNEGGCKLPEKTNRLTGYSGWGPGFAPYPCADKGQLHKLALKGVCLHTQIHTKEFENEPDSQLRRHKHKLGFSSKEPNNLTHLREPIVALLTSRRSASTCSIT